MNFTVLKVILNHLEERDFNNSHFYVYTLTDFSSGHNFDIWSLTKLNFLDSMKVLLECKTIKFEVLVKSNGAIKLKPIEVAKEV